MKTYILYDIDDTPKLLLRQVHDALESFLRQTEEAPGKFFSHGLLATLNNHTYRVGIIFDSFDELLSIPKAEIPPMKESRILGECIDLSKLPNQTIDKSLYVHSS